MFAPRTFWIHAANIFDLGRWKLDLESADFEPKQALFEVESPDFVASSSYVKSKRRLLDLESADLVLK